jgi:transcriptional antiterminator NusG
MSDTVSTKKWYAVQAKPNMEKQVLAKIMLKIESSSIADAFGRVLVPEEQVREVKNGQNKISTRKLYPGYVLVEMDFSEAGWHLIKSTDRVMGFVGGSPTKPTPMRASEVEIILRQIEETKDAPVPKLTFEIGEMITMTEGPFKDYDGEVTEVNYNQNKLEVSISIFGRGTGVKVDFANVVKKS